VAPLAVCILCHTTATVFDNSTCTQTCAVTSMNHADHCKRSPRCADPQLALQLLATAANRRTASAQRMFDDDQREDSRRWSSGCCTEHAGECSTPVGRDAGKPRDDDSDNDEAARPRNRTSRRLAVTSQGKHRRRISHKGDAHHGHALLQLLPEQREATSTTWAKCQIEENQFFSKRWTGRRAVLPELTLGTPSHFFCMAAFGTTHNQIAEQHSMGACVHTRCSRAWVSASGRWLAWCRPKPALLMSSHLRLSDGHRVTRSQLAW
jgi:mannose-6-phosphate isomerase-like protein (cupin superfamily)